MLPVVAVHFETGQPTLELAAPVLERRTWTDDQMRATKRWLILLQPRQKRNRLNCFAQTHFIGQNRANVHFVNCRVPVEAAVLVWLEIIMFLNLLFNNHL